MRLWGVSVGLYGGASLGLGYLGLPLVDVLLFVPWLAQAVPDFLVPDLALREYRGGVEGDGGFGSGVDVVLRLRVLRRETAMCVSDVSQSRRESQCLPQTWIVYFESNDRVARHRRRRLQVAKGVPTLRSAVNISA